MSVLLLNSERKLIHNRCACKLIIKTLWLHTIVSLFSCFNPLLTTRPGAGRGSRFRRGLFVDRSSSSASGLFLFSFVGDQTNKQNNTNTNCDFRSTFYFVLFT